MLTRFFIAVLVCLASPSFAEEDDLAPLAPVGKPKPKAPVMKPKPLVPNKVKTPAKAKPPPLADDDLAPLGVTKGEVVVRVVPASATGAVVWVDGKEVGPASSAHSVLAGEHTVTVKRAGFANFVKKVTVSAGKPVEFEAKLSPVLAVLSVSSDLSGAQVFINGKLIGTTPIVEREWPAGQFELTIRKEGVNEDRRSVTFVAGRDYPISVKLQTPVLVTAPGSDRPIETSLVPSATEAPLTLTATSSQASQPIYQRWYFWVGVAAVVAAGVGVGIAVNQPPPKPRPLTYRDFESECPVGSTDCPAACLQMAECSATGRLMVPTGLTF